MMPAAEETAAEGEREYPALSRPPIVEAMLDFQTRDPGLDPDQVQAFAESLADRYPMRELRKDIEFQISFDGESTRKERPRGWLLRSEDRTRALGVRSTGLTFSRLQPYESWSEFSGEARARWQEYLGALKPEIIERIGLRYINRINIPRDAQFEDYFASFPRLAEGLPQSFAASVMRLEVPYEGAMVIVTQTIDVRNVTESEIPIVLDIDVIRTECEMLASSADVWSWVERFRNVKNLFFWKSITAKTRGLYE